MQLGFREAHSGDLPALVGMLSNDDLGAQREDSSRPLNPDYLRAFEEINQDANNELIVVENGGECVGMLQLTFIPYLTHIGSRRCLIEGVRICSQHRGQGFGAALFEWAIERAEQRQCNIVQLTCDKQRPKAIQFYESLGFEASHEGMKLRL